MAEEQHELSSSSSADNTGGANEATAKSTPRPSHPSVDPEERSAISAAGRVGDTEITGGSHLHRSGTVPARPGRVHGTGPSTADNLDIPTRRRGRTLSSKREVNQVHPRPLSPRSQIFRRAPSNSGAENDGTEGGLDAIPERGHPEPGPSGIVQRGSLNYERPSFVSPSLRPRISTWAASHSPNRPRGSTLTRRPSVTLAAQATGIEIDGQSQSSFTLAGPAPVETIQANQPYVDPGYAELNPAYDQPANTRPVWGLAKPLPRVIRPGMIPTKSELKIQILEDERQKQDENVDLEQGRVQPTLRVDKISSQLQSARAERENRLVQIYSRTAQPPSAFSPIGRQTSSIAGPLSPPSEVIEEEDIVAARPSDLAPVPEQPSRVPSTVQFGEFHHRGWYPDDAASAVTEHEGEGDLDGDWIGDHADAIPLTAYEEDTDEIHNLHTHWSVIRLRFREPLAELLAVIVQLTLGFCADLAVTTSNYRAGNEEITDWAWGLATMVGTYIAGGISGAHLNPAISIMLYIYRGFPLRKVPMYLAAQILGAFIAGLIAFGLFRKDIIAYGGSNLANSGTLSTAFFTEFVGTAILGIAVLALGDDGNAPPGAGMNALIIGLVIVVLSMAFGYNTGAAMNPSRDLGPRLAVFVVGYGGDVFRNGYWVYGPWAATISGAIFGGFLYDAAIFVGGESPVNYPRRRIKRVGHKWKNRWGARLRRQKRKIQRAGNDEVMVNGEKW